MKGMAVRIKTVSQLISGLEIFEAGGGAKRLPIVEKMDLAVEEDRGRGAVEEKFDGPADDAGGEIGAASYLALPSPDVGEVERHLASASAYSNSMVQRKGLRAANCGALAAGGDLAIDAAE